MAVAASIMLCVFVCVFFFSDICVDSFWNLQNLCNQSHRLTRAGAVFVAANYTEQTGWEIGPLLMMNLSQQLNIPE